MLMRYNEDCAASVVTNTKKNEYTLIFFLIMLIALLGCKKATPDKVPSISKKVNVQVLLDVSASMAGYLRGNEFRSTIGGLAASLDNIKKDSLAEIKITTISFLLPDKSNRLIKATNDNDAVKFISLIGNRKIAVVAQSPIFDILSDYLKDIDSNTVKIFISDLIIDKDPSNFPTIQSHFNTLANTLHKVRKMAISIYRLTSDFNGPYYFNKKPGSINLSNTVRPYFIVIIGKPSIIGKLSTSLHNGINFNTENEIHLGFSFKQPAFNVLFSDLREGKWGYKEKQKIIRNAKPTQGQKTKFTMAIDFSDYPKYYKTNEYLNRNLEIASTVATLDTNNGIEVFEKTSLYNKLSKTGKEQAAKATHLISVSLTNVEDDGLMEFELYNELPKWYDSLSEDDDSDIKNTIKQTYGLKYIVTGLANAYGEINTHNKLFHLFFKLEK